MVCEQCGNRLDTDVCKNSFRHRLADRNSASCDTNGRLFQHSLSRFLIRLFGSSAFSAYRVSVAEDAAAASALSRIGSGVVNFALNRKWSFQSKGRIGAEMVRYLVLFLANLFCNASAVAGLTLAGVPAALGKFMVDVVLFLVNYLVQKRWVFSK